MCYMRCSLFASAKVRSFSDMTKQIREKKQKKMPNRCFSLLTTPKSRTFEAQ